MNDRTAKLLLSEDRYDSGATSPTRHTEYECPCGGGRIVYECAGGFDDRWVRLECAECAEKYRIVEGCGYIWSLEKR